MNNVSKTKRNSDIESVAASFVMKTFTLGKLPNIYLTIARFMQYIIEEYGNLANVDKHKKFTHLISYIVKIKLKHSYLKIKFYAQE